MCSTQRGLIRVDRNNSSSLGRCTILNDTGSEKTRTYGGAHARVRQTCTHARVLLHNLVTTFLTTQWLIAVHWRPAENIKTNVVQCKHQLQPSTQSFGGWRVGWSDKTIRSWKQLLTDIAFICWKHRLACVCSSRAAELQSCRAAELRLNLASST